MSKRRRSQQRGGSRKSEERLKRRRRAEQEDGAEVDHEEPQHQLQVLAPVDEGAPEAIQVGAGLGAELGEACEEVGEDGAWDEGLFSRARP